MSITTSNTTKVSDIKRQAEKGMLPASLLLNDIVELWTPDKEAQISIRKALLEDHKKGVLVTVNSAEITRNDSLKIHRD